MEELNNTTVPVAEEQAIAVAAPTSILNYLDNAAMNRAFKTASFLSKSDLLPEAYKDKPANVLIAMDLASRMGMSLSLVAQNLYIVKGKPAWSGSFCIAAICGCGKFSPLRFVDVQVDGGGCYATATRLSDGEVCASPAITMQLAKDEGWLDKSGSKWKTMPEQMARYRAASFFARTYCPEVLMGIQTVEEVRDVSGYEAEKETVKITLG